MQKLKTLVVLLFLLQPFDSITQEISPEITLEDIFKSGKFRGEHFPGVQSMKDGQHYIRQEKGSFIVYDYETGEQTDILVSAGDLVPPGDTTPVSINAYALSMDEKRILIASQTESIYRHSSQSYYYIYDLKSRSLKPLSDGGKQRLAEFSPDGKMVAFVRENNLFIKDLETNQEYKVTNDGMVNEVINGATDWVYEEEFGFTKAFHWSPDGKKLAFYKFDESNVMEFTMMFWGDLYPEPYRFKYPKAGEANSEVKIMVYDLPSGHSVIMDTGEETDIYIPRIKWTQDPEVLSIQRMNRHQNELEILLANVNTGNTESLYTEKNRYYIDITDDLTFLKNGEQFLMTSEQDGYNHIYLFDMLGNLEAQITKGEWDVSGFIGLDEENGIVYYSSAESSPLNREVYSIKLDGTGKTKLSEKEGTNRAVFSEKFIYYINTFSDANTPPVITLHRHSGEKVRDLVDNQKLKQTIADYKFVEKEFFKFTTSEGIELNGWMMKPDDFDPNRKYPVLMYVYGGPGSQTVQNSWGGGGTWYQYLVSRGLIVVSVDNRGTGSRGEEFKKMTYLQLGKYETLDQMEAAKYLGSLGYVDPQRIGIWGWSYGGYMAALCLTKAPDLFSAGIAVAPVTNWRYYDNIYTERFMRTPQENPAGYDDNSPINHADKLKGRILLIHGTADDNVHVQNTMDFVSALVAANKQFDLQLYPNSNHGIYTGVNTSFHLYTRMTNFIFEYLLQSEK
ncbi:MAG: S9 family peptidase [Bacteroidales bacterium]